MFAKKFYDIGNGEEFAESSRHMSGVLAKWTGQTEPEVVRQFNSSKADSMPVKDLLLAAGFEDLDAPSDAVGHEDETFRCDVSWYSAWLRKTLCGVVVVVGRALPSRYGEEDREDVK